MTFILKFVFFVAFFLVTQEISALGFENIPFMKL